MIRFIDLRGQDTGCRFAYWDTVLDKFLNFYGSEAWDLWSEFESDYDDEYDKWHAKPLERFRAVTPDWAFTESENMDEERFSKDFHP